MCTSSNPVALTRLSRTTSTKVCASMQNPAPTPRHDGPGLPRRGEHPGVAQRPRTRCGVTVHRTAQRHDVGPRHFVTWVNDDDVSVESVLASPMSEEHGVAVVALRLQERRKQVDHHEALRSCATPDAIEHSVESRPVCDELHRTTRLLLDGLHDVVAGSAHVNAGCHEAQCKFVTTAPRGRDFHARPALRTAHPTTWRCLAHLLSPDQTSLARWLAENPLAQQAKGSTTTRSSSRGSWREKPARDGRQIDGAHSVHRRSRPWQSRRRRRRGQPPSRLRQRARTAH